MSYEMQYSKLGKTDLMVSRIGFGGAGFGGIYTPISVPEAEACISKAYHEYGINYIDTSASYGVNGASESTIGQILEKIGLRKNVLIATKCGDFLGDTGYVFNYDPEKITKNLELQLGRLRTDYVDVLQLHDIEMAPSLDYLLEETIPALVKLKEQGKVRAIGITTVHNSAMKYVLERTDALDMILTFGRYNLMDTSLVGYFDELRAQKGFGMLNCSVLFMGFLTKQALGKGYQATGWFRNNPKLPAMKEALQKAVDICDAHGVDIGSLAVQFGCDCAFCDSTVLSMGRVSRLDQNMALLKQPYDKELAWQVHEILSAHTIIPEELF